MKKNRIIKNNIFIIKKIFSIDSHKIIFDVIYQILTKSKMFIFGIFYPLVVFKAIENGNSFSKVLLYVGIALGINLFVDGFLGIYSNKLDPIKKIHIMETVNREIYTKSTQIDVSNYENPEYYEQYNRMIQNVEQKFLSVESSFLNCIFDCIYLLLTMSIMIDIDAAIVVFIIMPIVISFFIGGLINKTQYKYNEQKVEENRKKDYVTNLYFSKEYAKEIRLTKITSAINKFNEKAFMNSTDNVNRYGWILGIKKALAETLGRYVVYIGAMAYVTYNILVTKSFGLSDFYFLLSSIITLSWYLNSTIKNLLSIGDNSLYVEDYISFLSKKNEQIDDDNIIKSIDFDDMNFEFKNVSFAYPGNSEYVLKNLNFTISKNQKIALVGFNGAGKTTIIKLLMRFYKVTEGEILLNGINIEKFDLNAYRNIFSSVFQDFQIYAYSVAQNVAMGDEYNGSLIDESLQKAGIFKRISALKDKIETNISKEFVQEGEVFSGGENQMLALARAFYKDSPIVILDEPSSFLDPYAEKMIFDKMIESTKNKLTVFVSHRLSSAILADKIIYIENGEILEQGNHSELMKNKARYYEIFKIQASSYVESEVENEDN